jgi:anti-anti-sigma factor
MDGQAGVIYESPSLRILEMTAPVGIRLIGHVELSDRDELERALKRLFSTRPDIYIDLSKLEYTDVGGMRTIFDAGAYIADDGCRLILLDPNPVVHRLVQLCAAFVPTTVEVKWRSDIANVPGQA